jgi:hypothetical protein
MKIATQPAFDQGRSTNHATAAQIAFGGKMHIATRSNRSAESARDLVVAKVYVRAASGADCRRRAAANLLFPLTFEALDNRAALTFPKIPKPIKDGRIFRRGGRFFFCPQLQAWFRRKWRKVTTALATDRAFGCRILRLLEATVRAFHTDLGRRRIGHWVLSQKPFPIRVLRRPP